MSKRARSPSPITVRTLANLVRHDTTSPKDAEFIDLALVLFRLFNHFGEDLLKKLMKMIVQAEVDDLVTLHSIENARAPSRAYEFSRFTDRTSFDNSFIVRRGHWWSRLFANILILRSAFHVLDPLEENFWREFNVVVGTLRPNVPFALSRYMPSRHYLGDWMRFRSPMVSTRVFHLDGSKHEHTYFPASMAGAEFYALFPANAGLIAETIDNLGSIIKVPDDTPPSDYGGPGLPFTSVTRRTLEEGEDYKLEKQMYIWKKHVINTGGAGEPKLEWRVDREFGRAMVHDFDHNPKTQSEEEEY